ncbi:hypothetical protein E0Z10_g3497 [Xylaria hypoxylon]|uniref:Uncharacterized protein n=1 Tax=Xylaria hypoxylon TaxID=37992 RepID=A0A4Z0Z3D2_9PEZI|nr:hypothetical protein E0Z10_g3497 [Xylaria hypoxylon]
MAFGTPEPTKEETTLNLSWDCTEMEHVTRQVANQWIWESTGDSPFVDHRVIPLPFYSLKTRDTDRVQKALRIDKVTMAERVERLLNVSLSDYMLTRNKLLSLLISWEQVILEKRRYDQEGFQPSDSGNGLTHHQFYVLVDLIWGIAGPGQSSLQERKRNVVSTETFRYRSAENAKVPDLRPTDKLDMPDSFSGSGRNPNAPKLPFEFPSLKHS